MTLDKVRSVFEFYQLSALRNVDPVRFPGDVLNQAREYEKNIAHLRWMCQEGIKLCDEGRHGKPMRWLGFVQGALWRLGIFTIDQLKDHNRPVPVTVTLDKKDVEMALLAFRALRNRAAQTLTSQEKEAVNKLARALDQ